MNKPKITCLLLAFLALSFSVVAQISKIDIEKAIDIQSLKHPYLYFTDQEKPEIVNRIKNDKESNDIFRRLEAEAKMLVAMPVDYQAPVPGKNPRAGWSEADRESKYENYFMSYRVNAFNLAFLYQITGDKRYAEKAFEFADAICDLPSWTLRPHEFPIIYSRVMPWNVPNDQVCFNFDHYNGDTARMMAAVYDWLYSALTPAQRDRLRGALIEKVVTRVRGNYEFHWWASAYRCNWCGVNNSGVGLTGLTLLTENPQLTDIVAESYNRINNMLSQLGVDGEWQEGSVYWTYGIHTSTFFADALNRLSRGKYNLFENERLKNNPATFPIYISLPGVNSANFEDSRPEKTGNSHLINKLATETKNGAAAWYRKEFFTEGTDIFDILWPRPSITPTEPKPASIHFRTTDWWVMRSDFKDPNKFAIVGKAGMNDDPHHGHLDIGHFIINWKNENYIRDLGSGGYDQKYFDEVRWDYPQASSEGHNVVFVNGEKQIPGKLYKKPYNYEVGGKVLDFRTTTTRDYVLMDPSNAYPKVELKEWRRHVSLDKPVVAVVLDEIKANTGSKIQVRFHPGVNYQIVDNLVMLNGAEGKMVMIPLSTDKLVIEGGRHASMFVNTTSKFSWIDYFDTILESTNEKSLIASIFTSVNSTGEAQKIAQSAKISKDNAGNISVSFVKSGKKYVFNYTNTSEGLVLKK